MACAHIDGRIDVPGGQVFWRRCGYRAGIPLLVIHGGPGLTSRYLDGFLALSDTRPVFTWDQLDCGQSDCPRDPMPVDPGSIRRRTRSRADGPDAGPRPHPGP